MKYYDYVRLYVIKAELTRDVNILFKMVNYYNKNLSVLF